jgi:hypothetical protein
MSLNPLLCLLSKTSILFSEPSACGVNSHHFGELQYIQITRKGLTIQLLATDRYLCIVGELKCGHTFKLKACNSSKKAACGSKPTAKYTLGCRRTYMHTYVLPMDACVSHPSVQHGSKSMSHKERFVQSVRLEMYDY